MSEAANRSSTDTLRNEMIYSICSRTGSRSQRPRHPDARRTARMRATREFSPARPRLNPCVGGASIRPPSAHAGKPTREEHHGQGSDAQQQGKEEAEGGVEQEEERRPHPFAVRVGPGAAPARAESLRQEELAERRRGASPRPCRERRLTKAPCEAGAQSQALLRSNYPACCRMMRIRLPRRAIADCGLIAPRRPSFARAAREELEEWRGTTRLDEPVLLVGLARVLAL